MKPKPDERQAASQIYWLFTHCNWIALFSFDISQAHDEKGNNEFEQTKLKKIRWKNNKKEKFIDPHESEAKYRKQILR